MAWDGGTADYGGGGAVLDTGKSDGRGGKISRDRDWFCYDSIRTVAIGLK